MSTPTLDQFVDDSVLSDGHILTTTVTAQDGSKLTSALDLNTIVGNVNGVLSWGGSNFSEGAQNVQFTNGGQLEADIPDSNGNLSHSMMWIGSIAGTDSNNQPAIHHYAVATYSTAHADADNNAQADSAVHGQAATTSDNKIAAVSTLSGDAASYWPDGNAPASGHHFSKPPWETTAHFVIMIIESILRML